MLGIVPVYFDQHYNKAVSVYLCATALGITIMPLVTQRLLLSYGWHGALVIISGIGTGIGMQSIPLSAVFHPQRSSQNTENTLLLHTAGK